MGKTVTLKKISLENYKKFDSGEFSFSHKTEVSGRNGHGKTSLMDAYFDVLTGKISDGTLPNNVRMKVDGEEVSDPVVREITIDVDGTETVIRKETKKGKTTSTTKYQVDDFDYNKSKYEEFLQKIVPIETIMMCSNANVFLNDLRKNTAGARENLSNMAGFDMEKFLSEHSEYLEANELTKGNSVEKTLSTYRKKRNDKNKEARDKDKELRKAKNVQIAVDDTLPVKLLDIEGKIKEVDAEDDKLIDLRKTYDSLSLELIGLKKSRDSIVDKAGESLREENQKKASLLYKLKMAKNQKADELGMLKADVDGLEDNIKEYERQLTEYREEYRKWDSEKWDDTELIRIRGEEFDPEKAVCPTCGQNLPEQQVEALKRSFEFKKQTRIQEQNDNKERFEKVKLNTLSEISLNGNRAKAELEKAKADKKDKESRIEELKAEIKQFASELEKAGEEVKSIPEEPDLAANEEYKAVCAEIAKKEETLNSLDNGEDKRISLNAKRRELASEQARIQEKILMQEKEQKKKDGTIAELELELRELSQEEANLQAKFDMLKEFSIAKNKALADMINPYFKHFQFKFLDYTQDGDPLETCRLMVNGIDYMNGLNHSDQILCNIDLVKGLQEMNGLNLPIWVDDAESVNSDRIPDTGRQMILLRVSDGELEVKEI